MKKKIILRSTFGFPVGIAIGCLISIFTSLGLDHGDYLPCTSELISACGNEINAVIFQTILCGLLGLTCSAASVIWEIESWNLMKQTVIYFLIISFVMMPIAYFLYWMEHTITGFLSYLGTFVIIFIIVWLIQYIIGKHIVKNMNNNLSKLKNTIINK